MRKANENEIASPENHFGHVRHSVQVLSRLFFSSGQDTDLI